MADGFTFNLPQVPVAQGVAPQAFQPLQFNLPINALAGAPLQFQPTQAIKMPSAQPELIGAGLASGSESLMRGIGAAIQAKKQQAIDKAKTDTDNYWKWQEVQLQKAKIDEKEIKDRAKATLPGISEEMQSADEAHKMLQGVQTAPAQPPATAPLKEPQFKRDVSPGSITVPKSPSLGDNTANFGDYDLGVGSVPAGSILTPSAVQQQNSDLLASVALPPQSQVQAAPAMAFAAPPTPAATPSPTPTPTLPVEINPHYSVASINGAGMVNPTGPVATAQYNAATASPSPVWETVSKPSATPQPMAAATPVQQVQQPATTAAAAPVSPAAITANAASTPAPTPKLDPAKSYDTPNEIAEAFNKIKQPDTTKYDMPQYSVFRTPQDAALYASKYANPDYIPYKVDSKPDKNGLYHIQWKDVRDARLKAEATDAEHQTKHLEAAERFGRMNEAGLKAEVDDYNAGPTAKLLENRSNQVKSFMNVSDMALSGKPGVSRSITDLDAIDSFIAFARGTQPTESQYAEIQHYSQGILADLRQRISKGEEGARLSPEQVQTMRSLMTENWNGVIEGENAEIDALRRVVQQKHPEVNPISLPQYYKPLLTQEYMNSDIASAQRIMRQKQAAMKWASDNNKPQLHAAAAAEYEAAKARQYQYDQQLAEATAANGYPVNWDEWIHSRRGGWARGHFGGVPGDVQVQSNP